MGGHGTEPYEQKTQQSPAFGRSSVPHPLQAWKNMQASVGIFIASACPHAGHVSTDWRWTAQLGATASLTASLTASPPGRE